MKPYPYNEWLDMLNSALLFRISKRILIDHIYSAYTKHLFRVNTDHIIIALRTAWCAEVE